MQHIVQRGAGLAGLTQKLQLSTATFVVAFALALTPPGALGAYARTARVSHGAQPSSSSKMSPL